MKIIKAVCYISIVVALCLAIGLPFLNPWWFIYSFIVTVVMMAYGKEISEWSGSFMT